MFVCQPPASVWCWVFEVTLEVERLYGSLDEITVQYRLASVDETGRWNYHLVHYSSVTLRAGQVVARITVQVAHCSVLTLIYSEPQPGSQHVKKFSPTKHVVRPDLSLCLFNQPLKTYLLQ